MNKQIFYLQKYTKGQTPDLVKECILKGVTLKELQKIFGINPNDPDIIVRHMIDSYNVTWREAKHLAPYMEYEFDFDNYGYQIGASDDDLGNIYYFVSEFKKTIPYFFLDECVLNIPVNWLREIFKDTYDNDPSDDVFEPYINLDQKYADVLQPYATFKIDLENFDFWIEKRGINEPRYIGQPGEEFVG